MLKIKKGDTVCVITGKDKKKTGKVMKVFPCGSKAIVERINVVKKHARRRSEEQTGGIIQMEKPIHISNLMVLCKSCNKPTRVGITILKDGSKSRFCKRCQEVL